MELNEFFFLFALLLLVVVGWREWDSEMYTLINNNMFKKIQRDRKKNMK